MVDDIAVLAGDRFHSTIVDQSEAFGTRLDEVLLEVEQRYSARTATFRDDGFQVTLSTFHRVTEVALFIRAGLIAASPSRRQRWDARVVMALGPVENPRAGVGAAFVEAGRGLAEIDRRSLLFRSGTAALTLSLDLSTALVDRIVQGWTPSEAQVYYEHLKQPDGGHQAIAHRLNKSRPTVTQALLRAQYNLLDRYLRDSHQMLSNHYAR